MIFILILVGIIVPLVVIARKDALLFQLSVIISLVVLAAATFVLVEYGGSPTTTVDKTYELKAVSAAPSVSYYKFGDEGSSINYIYEDVDTDGKKFSVSANGDADTARIYEDADETPTVDVLVKTNDTFFFPIKIERELGLVFHVPAGSVEKDYAVTLN